MVYIPRLKTRGEVISLPDDQDIEVMVGRLRMRLERHEIERRSQPDQISAPVAESFAYQMPATDSPGLELHLRGMTVDEALPAVESYLDRAFLSGLPWVRLVHGKGGGILRQAIRDTLKNHPLVEHFQRAEDNSGGDGATVVTFVSR
jgi:DNA mismatch repair protein MutS2